MTWPPLCVAETRGAPTLLDALNEQRRERLAAGDRLVAAVTVLREVGAGQAESGRCAGLSLARLWGPDRIQWEPEEGELLARAGSWLR